MSYNLGNTDAITYDGQDVDKLTLNGTTIWEKASAYRSNPNVNPSVGDHGILDGQIIRITNPDGIPYYPYSAGASSSTTSVDVLLLSKARTSTGRMHWDQNFGMNGGIAAHQIVFPNIFSPWLISALYGEYRNEVFYPQANNIGIMGLGRWWYPAGVDEVTSGSDALNTESISIDLGNQVFMGNTLNYTDTSGNGIADTFYVHNLVWSGGNQAPLENPGNMSLENKTFFTNIPHTANTLEQSASNYSLEFIKTSPALPPISASPPSSQHTALDYANAPWGWQESGGFLIPKSYIYEIASAPSDAYRQHPLPYFVSVS